MATDATLRAIERRVTAHAGFQLPTWVLGARVRDRMQALRVEVAEAYLELLTGESARAELDALAERLRVGETRFFRHQAHVGALRRVVAADLAARGSTRVRAWSAGCATGEEAYTLAIVLGDALPGTATTPVAVDVLATDLSEEALAVARAGVYALSALEPVPAPLRERYFVPGPRPGTARVAPAIAAQVKFERKNLVDGSFPRRLDVILCRNVLIYFDAQARARTIEQLIDSLAPGGYLFLGYAESLREFSKLEALRTADGVVYRRPTTRPANRAAVRSPVPLPVPVPVPEQDERRERSLLHKPGTGTGTGIERQRVATVTVRIKGAHDDAATVAQVLRRAIGDATERVEVHLDGAEFLADEVAAVLRRATAAAQANGMALALVATRPGPRRWLQRHGLAR